VIALRRKTRLVRDGGRHAIVMPLIGCAKTVNEN